MNPQLIIAAALFVAGLGSGFGAAWKIQSGIAAEKEAENVKQTLRSTQDAAKTAIRRADNVIQAQSAAALRERVLRADAAGSRSALDGLRDAAAEALRTASASTDACIATATTASELLIAVSNERRELAEKADRHVSDIKMMQEAWPK